MPDDSVVSASNWQTWVPEFESSRYFLRGGIESLKKIHCFELNFNLKLNQIPGSRPPYLFFRRDAHDAV